MLNDSDEYDFNPSSSSKLATLFGNTKLSDDLNSSLTYTAPKQPKTRKEQELNESIKIKPQTSALLLAKIVSLWKLENNVYKSLGKHGLAVIGSTELNLYEIIAYKEKNSILLRIKINDKVTFHNKKDYFSTFYDNDNQNWLAKFENFNDQNLFCQTIESHGAKINSNMENTVENNEIRTKTTEEENKVIAEEEILQMDPQNYSVKELDVNSDSSGYQKRANILSRMAKMGQQILPSPLVKNTSTDISDSELDDSKNERKVPPRKFKRAIHTERNISSKEEKPPQTVQQKYVDTQLVPSQNTYNNYPAQLPQNAPGPLYYNQPMQYDGFNNFIMAQNAELKMNLAQISAKLDNALSQNNTSQINTGESTFKSKVKVLELKASNLENELVRYDRKYSNLEKMYKELEEKYNEKAECRDGAVLQDLKQEIDKLHANLREKEDAITAQEALKHSLEKCQNVTQEHEKTIELQKVKIKDLEEHYKQHNNNESKLTIDGLNMRISSLETELKDLEEYYRRREEKKRKQSEENMEIIDKFSGKIKEQMNSMYQSILSNFQEGSSYSVSDINSSITENLKGTTFRIINELKNVYKNKDIE